jgi:hypothetical protein
MSVRSGPAQATNPEGQRSCGDAGDATPVLMSMGWCRRPSEGLPLSLVAGSKGIGCKPASGASSRRYRFSQRERLHASANRRARGSAQQVLLGTAIAYLRFGVARPAHYRLMFGPELAEGDPIPCALER